MKKINQLNFRLRQCLFLVLVLWAFSACSPNPANVIETEKQDLLTRLAKSGTLLLTSSSAFGCEQLIYLRSFEKGYFVAGGKGFFADLAPEQVIYARELRLPQSSVKDSLRSMLATLAPKTQSFLSPQMDAGLFTLWFEGEKRIAAVGSRSPQLIEMMNLLVKLCGIEEYWLQDCNHLYYRNVKGEILL